MAKINCPVADEANAEIARKEKTMAKNELTEGFIKKGGLNDPPTGERPPPPKPFRPSGDMKDRLDEVERRAIEEAKAEIKSERLKISRDEFRHLLDLFMASDPWPLDDREHGAIQDMLNRFSKEHGFRSWTAAYHHMVRDKPTSDLREQLADCLHEFSCCWKEPPSSYSWDAYHERCRLAVDKMLSLIVCANCGYTEREPISPAKDG